MDKNLYIFVLGRLPELGAAELQALLATGECAESSDGIALLSLSQPLDNSQKTLDILGGTVKIGQVFDSISLPAKNLTDDAGQKIANRILEKFSLHKSKINYGISAYNIRANHENLLKNLLKNVKRCLAKNGKSSRFANNDFKNVHNVVAAGLIKKGAEILIAQSDSKIFLAETAAVQDFKSYELRDYDRPGRDINSGMLPPKIAQIMINLAGLRGFDGARKTACAPKTQSRTPFTIYDPFCGSGTILQEALLAEFDVIGSDIDATAVSNSEKNLKWLISQYHLANAHSRVFKKDIAELKSIDLPEKINAIISESYLGPRLTRSLPPEEARNTITKLENLYIGALKKIKELRLACPVIFAIAAFKMRDDNYIFAENFPLTAQKLGFELKPMTNSTRKSLIYDRPDQFVAREIFRFQLK